MSKTAARAKGSTLKTFTCLDSRGINLFPVKAESIADADRDTYGYCTMIIDGTAEDIGAKKVKEMTGKCFYVVEHMLKRGGICTICVGDPILVADAKYCGRMFLNGHQVLAFKKNGFEFVADHICADVRFVSIK